MDLSGRLRAEDKPDKPRQGRAAVGARTVKTDFGGVMSHRLASWWTNNWSRSLAVAKSRSGHTHSGDNSHGARAAKDAEAWEVVVVFVRELGTRIFAVKSAAKHG